MTPPQLVIKPVKGLNLQKSRLTNRNIDVVERENIPFVFHIFYYAIHIIKFPYFGECKRMRVCSVLIYAVH